MSAGKLATWTSLISQAIVANHSPVQTAAGTHFAGLLQLFIVPTPASGYRSSKNGLDRGLRRSCVALRGSDCTETCQNTA